jgi:hypothetical protein
MADFTLHVLDIRTPPPKEYLRSAMQHETLARVTPAVRSSGGAIGSHWYL